MATATYNGEEITIQFTARLVREDYGVAGSPSWMEPHDIEIDSVEILGHEIDFSTLPEALRAHFLELADDLEFEE